MKTFYIASGFENQSAVRALAAGLRDRGMDWEHDWTAHEVIHDADSPLSVEYADLDIEASVRADIFILLTPANSGGHCELGARLGSGRGALVIGAAQKMFYFHPKVSRFASVGEFLAVFDAGRAIFEQVKRAGDAA